MLAKRQSTITIPSSSTGDGSATLHTYITLRELPKQSPNADIGLFRLSPLGTPLPDDPPMLMLNAGDPDFYRTNAGGLKQPNLLVTSR